MPIAVVTCADSVGRCPEQYQKLHRNLILTLDSRSSGWGVADIGLFRSEKGQNECNSIDMVRWGKMVAENVHVGSTGSPTVQTPMALSTPALVIFL